MPGSFLPDNYLPILIFMFLAIAFGSVTLIIGPLFRPSKPYREKLSPYECGVEPFSDARIPFPMRYYVITMLFVIFDIEAIFLFPWAVVSKSLGIYALIEMMLFILILLVGYIYAWKMGALDWE